MKRQAARRTVWTPPTYPEPQPGDDALIQAQREKLRDLFGAPVVPHQAPPDRPMPSRVMLPPIDPRVRADCERRAATVSDRTEPPDLAEIEEACE